MIDINKRGMSMFLIVAIFFTLLASNGFAIGVSPTKREIEFKPNLHQELSVKIVNDQAKDMKAVVYARGELAEYISFPTTIVEISSKEPTKVISYYIDLPQKLEKAGLHEAEIVVMEFPEEFAEKDNAALIKAVGAVVSKLYVRVPYPSKYAEGELQISKANVGEDVVFTISMFNFGREDVSNIKATVDIFGPTYEKLGSVQSGEISLKASQSSKVVAKWPADVNAGVYHAIATIRYDEKSFILERNFDVGSLYIDVVDLIVEQFSLGQVAKMDLMLENKWNEHIKDVYGEVTVKDDKTVYTTFKTASIDIGPLATTTINSYWDTEGISVGKYEVGVVLHYAGKTTEKSFDIDVNIDSIRRRVAPLGEVVTGETKLLTASSAVMLLVVVLIVINIGWFVYIKKSKK